MNIKNIKKIETTNLNWNLAYSPKRLRHVKKLLKQIIREIRELFLLSYTDQSHIKRPVTVTFLNLLTQIIIFGDHLKLSLIYLQNQHSGTYLFLPGGFNPFEKYARQNGNLPQIGVKIKNIWNHQPVSFYIATIFWRILLKPLNPLCLPPENFQKSTPGHQKTNTWYRSADPLKKTKGPFECL